MGKTAPLTQAAIRAVINKPGRYRDGEGLLLFVRQPGQASWVARIQHDGKRRDYGLGSLKLFSLAEAREKCREIKRALKSGRDPHALGKPGKGMDLLFRDTAIGFLDEKFSPATRRQALARLKTYVFPMLGKMQLQSIDAEMIADVLRPIWTTKAETALRVRELIIRVLRYGRPDGPSLETTLARAISDRLPAQPRGGNFAAMPHADVRAFMHRLENKPGLGALALRTVILTATRGGEVRDATWSELDFDKAVWTIPAARMKMKRPHRIPLSRQAQAVFREAANLRRAGTDLIFPGAKGGPLSDMTLGKCMRDLKAPYVPHGFRSTFRDWAAEMTDAPGDVAEAALAHAVLSAVEASYKRTDFFDRRRDLMDAWGEYAAGGTVVPIGKARRA
jgi:integrase